MFFQVKHWRFLPENVSSLWNTHSFQQTLLFKSIRWQILQVFQKCSVPKMSQLSAWMLSHTLTTSGQSVRASMRVEAASICSWSKEEWLRGTNSKPADVICNPSPSREPRTLFRSDIAQINWGETHRTSS